MRVAPVSAESPPSRSSRSVCTLPPARPCPSRTIASNPSLRSSYAQERPASPPPTTTTFRFVSAARTNIAGAKAAAAAAARKFRRFIITSSLSLASLETKQLHHTSIEKLYIRALITHGKITDVRCGVLVDDDRDCGFARIVGSSPSLES